MATESNTLNCDQAQCLPREELGSPGLEGGVDNQKCPNVILDSRRKGGRNTSRVFNSLFNLNMGSKLKNERAAFMNMNRSRETRERSVR